MINSPTALTGLFAASLIIIIVVFIILIPWPRPNWRRRPATDWGRVSPIVWIRETGASTHGVTASEVAWIAASCTAQTERQPHGAGLRTLAAMTAPGLDHFPIGLATKHQWPRQKR